MATRWRTTWSLLHWLLPAIVLACSSGARAGDGETMSFPSAGTIVKGANGRYEVREATVKLSGILRVPDGPGPFPAVVLAHGCSGFGYGDLTWLALLRQWGYATFAVDSFGPRGLPGVCSTGAIIPLESVPDVYGALRHLATHPRIDPGRLALMGFSHEGIVTSNAATDWATRLHARAGQPRFRAFVAFYPYYNNRYPERDTITAPLRIHAGALDDWTPAQPCVDWVDELKSKGQDAAITVYPGARHSFDRPTGDVELLAQAANFALCSPVVPHIAGPYPFKKLFAKCLKLGAHAGRDGEATALAIPVVQRELAELLARD